MSHVTHTNDSCHAHKWVARLIEPRCTYAWVVSHLRMSRVAPINESWHTYKWVLSNIWMSRVGKMNESCHTYEGVSCPTSEWVMSHMYLNESGHTYMWHDPLIRATSRSHRRQKLACSCRMAALVSRRSWVRPHTRMIHVTRTSASCRTYTSVIPYVWMSHVALSFCCMAAHAYCSSWVSLHIQMSHVTPTRNFK